MDKKRLYSLAALFLTLILISFNQAYKRLSIRDDKLYVVKDKGIVNDIEKIDSALNIKVPQSFQDIESVLMNNTQNQILLTVSKDKRYSFFMNKSITKNKSGSDIILKGSFSPRINLVKKDNSTGESHVIAQEIPFITKVKWSPDGRIAGFCGGGRLTLYDEYENKTIMQEDLKGEAINYFGWSPDSQKLYTEQDNLPNGIIAYPALEKKAESYEIKENAYFKYPITGSYYYGTIQTINPADLLGSSTIRTAVIDGKGTIVKDLGDGYFRDAYGPSLLLIDRNGSLKFLPSLDSPEVMKQITRERIYDAGFFSGGGFAFTTAGKDIEKNSFILHITNGKGEEIENLEISGSSFLISPDGKYAYISGCNWESIDLINHKTIDSYKNDIEVDNDEKIFATLRGALSVIYNYVINPEKDMTAAGKYFDISTLPQQLAYINSKNIWKDENLKALFLKQNWDTTMKLKALRESDENGIRKASIKVEITASTLWMDKLKNNFDVTLIKKADSWLVTSITASK